MDNTYEVLISIGGIMLLGLMTDYLGKRTFLPRVTLLLIFGMLIGPNAFDLLPDIIISNFELITNVALVMIGFLVGGLAIWLEVSYLIAAIVMGMTIVNLAKHHDCSFHEIENIEPPFLILFFVLAGASLEFGYINEIGLIACIYIIARIIGKIIGAKVGGAISRTDASVQNWMGIALMPQAGVAMGMALVASNQLPEYRQLLLSVAISTTIFFELFGPVFTTMALKKAVVD